MAVVTFKIEWDAYEHEHKERTVDWFWAVGIITVSIAIAAIIFGNIIFAILILISAFSLSMFINVHPPMIHVSVDERGITRGSVRYPFTSMHSFWIDIEHPHPKIILRSKKLLMPLIIIPLATDTDEEDLKATLDQFLPEEYMRLPLTEQALEYLGF